MQMQHVCQRNGFIPFGPHDFVDCVDCVAISGELALAAIAEARFGAGSCECLGTAGRNGDAFDGVRRRDRCDARLFRKGAEKLGQLVAVHLFAAASHVEAP